MKELLTKIVAEPSLHAQWLNSLSFLENTGARKISASENTHTVNLMILKHAAEEARHAYYLKKQIEKLGVNLCPDYSPEYLLAPGYSYSYLNLLDVHVSRYLKKTLNLAGSELRFASYLLVTYAIELRADVLYPVYQEVLTEFASKVTVKSIILEEEGHLQEMIHQLKQFSADWEQHATLICTMEERLFSSWISGISKSLS